MINRQLQTDSFTVFVVTDTVTRQTAGKEFKLILSEFVQMVCDLQTSSSVSEYLQAVKPVNSS